MIIISSITLVKHDISWGIKNLTTEKFNGMIGMLQEDVNLVVISLVLTLIRFDISANRLGFGALYDGQRRSLSGC